MASFQHTILKESVKRIIHSLQIRHSNIPFVRRFGDIFTARIPLPANVRVTTIDFENFHAEMIRPEKTHKDFILMYLHGGGYSLGSTKTHRAFVAKIAAETGLRALSVDYRLAPENPFPAALDDALACYDYLLKHFEAKNIFLAGDSAGGGLVLSTMLALRELGKPLPAAAVCFAPWTDLKITGKSVWENKTKDAMLEHFDIENWAKMYYQNYEPTHPLISPLYADLKGLPPLLIQVSEDEILRDDSLRFAYKAKEAGVEIELQKWKGLIHVWQIYWQYVPEARDAIHQVKVFLKEKMAHQPKNHPIVNG